MTRQPHRLLLGIAGMALLGSVAGVHAQVATTPPPAPVLAAPEPLAQAPQELPNRGISPRGAFLRALVVPGWGHAAIGSYTRGGFYVGVQTLTAYTLLRTRARLSEVRDRARFQETLLRARLASEGITDPTAVEEALDSDGELSNVRRLLEAREEQQTDIIALGLFLLLMSGADAYVSAHLARFPEPLELEARPSATGVVDVSLRLTIN